MYDCIFVVIYLFQHFSTRSCLENFAKSLIGNLCDGKKKQKKKNKNKKNLCDGVGIIFAEK